VAKQKTVEPKQKHHLDRRAGHLADLGKGNAEDELTSQELADWLGVCEQWVVSGRAYDYGPPFIKPYPRVTRYKRGAVIKWLRERAQAYAARATEDA
jgi:hypothetical protein